MRKLQVLGVLSVLAALVSAPAVAQDRVVCRVGGVSGPCPGDASVPGTMYASNFLTTGGPLDVNISKVGGTAIGLTVPVSGSVLTSIDATLTLLNAKFGALGQQLAAASAPVVLPAAQVALLAQAAQFPAALVGGRMDVNIGASTTLTTTGNRTPADGVANPTTLVGAQAFLMGWNPNTSQWDRIFAEGIQSDNDNGPSSGLLSAENYPMLFDGTNWDRWRSSSSTSGSARMLPHDGTNGAGITAASTAAAAADPGLVVSLSPNSPTPRHNDTACSGTLTNDSPTLTCKSLNGVGSVGFHLAYGATGSVSATCSYDGTNYDGAIPMTPSSAPATPVTSVSASGDWIFSAAGCKAVRFTLAGGTGSHTVTANISAIPAPAYATANQGAATTTAGAWPVKVTDGTNTAAVKAASTAAAAADPAAVVTQHPYSAAADSFTLISATTAATVVKNSPGVLRKVCVWIPSSGGSGGFYVYDNASAASGNAPVVMFTTTQNCFALDVRMANGITVQMTTAAATVGLYYN